MNTHKTTASSPKISRFLLLILLPGICGSFALPTLARQIDAREYLRSPAPINGPAGLTVIRNSATNNIVSWDAVWGATSYTLQRRWLSPATTWVDVTSCDPASTVCTDIAPTSAAYAYRVQATNGLNYTAWSNVAVFLSEPNNDGYVVGPPFATNSVVPNDAQPGIHAGQGLPGTVGSSRDLRGFLSFNTSFLGSNATMLGARLRLKQSTSNDAFDLLGPCMVDIQTGDFSANAALQIGDFYYTDANTTLNAFEVTGVGPDQWFQAELGAPEDIVSNDDYTQFRIYFNHSSTINKYAGWYSGESSSNSGQPQLIVRYKE